MRDKRASKMYQGGGETTHDESAVEQSLRGMVSFTKLPTDELLRNLSLHSKGSRHICSFESGVVLLI